MSSPFDPQANSPQGQRQSAAQITARLLGVFAFNDFDIEGHSSIKRVTIAHQMRKGDHFNVYHRSGAKEGGVWKGCLRKSLEALLSCSRINLVVGSAGVTHVDRKGYFWAQSSEAIGGEVVGNRFCPVHGWTPTVDRRWISSLRPLPPNPLSPSALMLWAGPDNLSLVDSNKGQ